MVSWARVCPHVPLSYPATSVVVSRGLLCPRGLDGGCVGCWLGSGCVVLTEGLEGDEQGTVVIHGVPCPRKWGEKGSGAGRPPLGPLTACRALGSLEAPRHPPQALLSPTAWVSITFSLCSPSSGSSPSSSPGRPPWACTMGRDGDLGTPEEKSPGDSAAGREELRGKHGNPPATPKSPGCQVSPGKGRERLSSSQGTLSLTLSCQHPAKQH